MAAEGQKVSVIKSISGFDISLQLCKVGGRGYGEVHWGKLRERNTESLVCCFFPNNSICIYNYLKMKCLKFIRDPYLQIYDKRDKKSREGRAAL